MLFKSTIIISQSDPLVVLQSVGSLVKIDEFMYETFSALLQHFEQKTCSEQGKHQNISNNNKKNLTKNGHLTIFSS